MSKHRRDKLKRKELQDKEPPKPDWRKYLLLPVAGVAIALGAYGIAGRKGAEPQVPVPRISESAPAKKTEPFKLPPATILIVDRELGKGDRRFKEVDAIVESAATKTGFANCPFKLGKKDDLPATASKLKKGFKEKGLDIVSGESSTRAILERLQSFYMENNTWLIIRTGKKSDRLSGTTEKVSCLFRFPIVGKASLSYSYFDGKLSASDIPVFYLTGKGMPEAGDYVQGVTTKHGLMVFSDVDGVKNTPPKELIYEITIHEGIHFRSIPKDEGKFPDDLDFDANADTPESAQITLLRQKDELRAFLIQMMYGNHPQVAFESLLHTRLDQYIVAKSIFRSGMEEMLKDKPDRYRRYLSGRFTYDDFTDDELRRLAYNVFIKAGL